MSRNISRPIKNIKQRRDVKRSRARKKVRFDKLEKTLSGTYIYKKMECNSLPLPSFLLKAMENEWAEKLVSEGIIRLGSLSYYQKLDNDDLGDPLEGEGEFVINGKAYSTGSINKHYVWCAAQPKTKHSTLLDLDKKYDVIVKVSDVPYLVERIVNALLEKGFSISLPHLGRINYNRSSKANLKSLNSQRWLWNCFQKRKKYQHQNEYRIPESVTL
tara:strand:+ start:1208 stop:1855 length:648 start_codon:yes stop_codon:yes gene_type:complete